MDKMLLAQYESSAQKAQHWLRNQADKIEDIEIVFRLPYLLLSGGHIEHAHRLLQKIYKSLSLEENPAIQEFQTEIASWIGISAHKMNRFDISYMYMKFLRTFYDPDHGAFVSCAPYGHGESVLDLYSAACIGWMSLFFGDTTKTMRAGSFLQRGFALQSDKLKAFYLRLSDNGRLITAFNAKKESYYVIGKHPQNAYKLGMMAVFLGKAYLAVKDEMLLRAAQSYQEIAHQHAKMPNPGVMWASAVLANITQEDRYVNQAMEAARQLLESQSPEGCWLRDNEKESIQSTIFNAIGLREVIAEMS